MTTQFLERAMLLTGGFEGSDPWANITGNFDDAGLTCGQLGKTIAAGDQQAVVKSYLAAHGKAGLLSLMPQTGEDYIKIVNKSIKAGMAIVVSWSDSKGRVKPPYAAELAAFWKSPLMIIKQREHAVAHEGKSTREWLADWNGSGSFQEYALFFDIAAQNGSLKGVDAHAVSNFIGSDVSAALATAIKWIGSAPTTASGYKDSRLNAELWSDILPKSGKEVLRLFILAYLRARKAKPQWQWDTMNRKGSFATGEGWVHRTKWNLLDKLEMAGPAEDPVVDSAPKAIVVEMPSGSDLPVQGTLYRVAAISGLRLRSTPHSKKKDNILGAFPNGRLVRFIAKASAPGWWQVSVDDAGTTKIGFMNAFLLSPLASPPPTSPAAAAEKLPLAPAQTGVASAVVAVHMPNPKKHLITRGGDSRAHKLNEQGAPARGNDSLPKRLASIHSIIDWLNPEGFKRYLPGGRETYCNIYAYDFGCLAGTYIPRVWWSQKAIHQLSLGASVNIKYNDTINELTANDLQRWFIDWGGHFGWSPVQSVDALQKHANTGGIALIVARSSKGHGHITMIVPENDDHKAKRNNTGTVTIPLESQAGSKNHNYVTKKSTWWTGSHFTVGFWIHA